MSFFRWQRSMLGGLMAWGTASVVAGAGAAASTDEHVRQVGLQAVAWGVVDLAIAVGGRRSAQAKHQGLADGKVAPEEVRNAAESLRRVLLINAGLDLGYILFGVGVARRNRDYAVRRGIGDGIAIQGTFLLGYDLIFVLLLGRQAETP
ncbi:MAG: hypothetical protein NVS2B7_27380 [Herpetosiphon sp.]